MPNVGMEESQQELRSLGSGILDTFKVLAEKPWNANKDSYIPSKRRVSAEEERFRLWARSLGLNQAGHASLDYRVRDASVISTSLADLLTEFKDHLENLSSIILGDRLPLELDIDAHRQSEAAPNVTTSSDEESSLSSLSSVGSFQEAEFRLESVTTRLDSLYKLAARIRSPRNRPQRPTRDLYKHIPESQRAQYIQNQEQIGISLVSYVQRQHLVEWVTDEQLKELGLSQELLLQEYAEPTHWLVRRTGIANARRKQQFVYWRKHAELLGCDMAEVPLPAISKEPAEAVTQPQVPKTDTGKPVPSVSMATSATRINSDILGLDDMKSVITSHSRASTTVSPKGRDLAWPPAPSHLAGSKYFSCPYCGILCPGKYLTHDEWRIHQIHDLRPYHCTYEECTDPNRLYGVRREWIDHENQHRRVWHCHVHEEEFETQPDYMRHLHDKRLEHRPEDSSTEMVAAAVGASSKPHRDCPFCPTAFSDVATMQRHVRYHLERLALYALPDIGEEGSELSSGQSSDSHQVVECRGRQNSATLDFTEEEEQSFLESSYRDVDDAQELHQSIMTMEDTQEFAASLELLRMPAATSHIESVIQWITNSHQTGTPLEIGNIPYSSRPEGGSSENANRVVNSVEPFEESKESKSMLVFEHPDDGWKKEFPQDPEKQKTEWKNRRHLRKNMQAIGGACLTCIRVRRRCDTNVNCIPCEQMGLVCIRGFEKLWLYGVDPGSPNSRGLMGKSQQATIDNAKKWTFAHVNRIIRELSSQDSLLDRGSETILTFKWCQPDSSSIIVMDATLLTEFPGLTALPTSWKESLLKIVPTPQFTYFPDIKSSSILHSAVLMLQIFALIRGIARAEVYAIPGNLHSGRGPLVIVLAYLADALAEESQHFTSDLIRLLRQDRIPLGKPYDIWLAVGVYYRVVDDLSNFEPPDLVTDIFLRMKDGLVEVGRTLENILGITYDYKFGELNSHSQDEHTNWTTFNQQVPFPPIPQSLEVAFYFSSGSVGPTALARQSSPSDPSPIAVSRLLSNDFHQITDIYMSPELPREPQAMEETYSDLKDSPSGSPVIQESEEKPAEVLNILKERREQAFK